jgi:hypothetical protein
VRPTDLNAARNAFAATSRFLGPNRALCRFLYDGYPLQRCCAFIEHSDRGARRLGLHLPCGRARHGCRDDLLPSPTSGLDGQLGAACQPQLGEGMRDVGLHRPPSDEHPLADLGIGQPRGDKIDDFQLGGCEAVPAACWALSLTPGPADVGNGLVGC